MKSPATASQSGLNVWQNITAAGNDVSNLVREREKAPSFPYLRCVTKARRRLVEGLLRPLA